MNKLLAESYKNGMRSQILKEFGKPVAEFDPTTVPVGIYDHQTIGVVLVGLAVDLRQAEDDYKKVRNVEWDGLYKFVKELLRSHFETVLSNLEKSGFVFNRADIFRDACKP